jgi:hypothetical protein
MRHLTSLRSLFYSVAFVSLCGCTYGFYAQVLGVPNMYAVSGTIESSSPDRGTLVGSIGSNTLPGWQFYQIEFRSNGKKGRGIVMFNSEPKSPLDWDEPDWKGRAFSVALPPGDYEFYHISVGGFGTRPRLDALSANISLPFRVERDGVVYVGELKWSQTQHESKGGLAKVVIPDHPPLFSISDRATRDVPVIRKIYPKIEGHPLRIEIPSVPAVVWDGRAVH